MNCQKCAGGVFTVSKNNKTYAFVRDKDIATLLTEVPSSVGFLGSDTYQELQQELRERIIFQEVAATSIRYALACVEDVAEMLEGRLSTGDCISVATSYPSAFLCAARQKGWCPGKIISIGGSVEACAAIVPGVDAVFDLVDTGRTLEDNNLVIIADNLGQLALGMAWQAE